MKKNEKVLIKVSPKNIFKAGIGLLAINEYRKGGFQAGLSVFNWRSNFRMVIF